MYCRLTEFLANHSCFHITQCNSLITILSLMFLLFPLLKRYGSHIPTSPSQNNLHIMQNSSANHANKMCQIRMPSFYNSQLANHFQFYQILERARLAVISIFLLGCFMAVKNKCLFKVILLLISKVIATVENKVGFFNHFDPATTV